MKAKIKINDVDTSVNVNRFVDVLEMHIDDLVKVVGMTLKNKLSLRNYIEVQIFDDYDKLWGSCVWVPPGKVTLMTTDGHDRIIPFDVFTQIVEVTPGIKGVTLEPINPLTAMNRDLFYDINKPNGLGFDIIATPSCTPESFEWGFNGGNGILAFKELYDKHVKWDRDRRHQRVILYHNFYMGYHFDQATQSTILKYYKPRKEKRKWD